MKDFLAFDTEDNSKELVAVHGHSFDKRVTQIAAMGLGCEYYCNKGDKEKFKEWLRGFDSGTVCYAHNLTYDLGNIFDAEIDKLDITMVGSRMITAKWENITFKDSYNIWPMGAAALGPAFGLEKLEFNSEGKEYVMRDVEIVYKAMKFAMEMTESYGVDRMPSTLGGLCVKVWAEMGGKTWQCVDDTAREAVFGGRVELFSKGGVGRIAYVDVNSLYPSVMRNKFPTGFEPRETLAGYGIATVDIVIPKMAVTPLPVRWEDGRIFYPYGELRGTWTLHEIRNAIRIGGKIKKIHSCWGSDDGEYYYKDFVEHFYKKRLTSKTAAEKLMHKLFLNNRFGQMLVRGNVTKSLMLADSDFNKEGFFNGEGVPYGTKRLANVKMPLPEHVNYLHGAYVTSYGRLILQQYLRMIPAEDLIYCDTDGIFFFQKDDTFPFPISEDLGEMKLEAIADRCIAKAPKMYQFGSTIKVKGVPKKQVTIAGRVRNPAEEMFFEGETEFALPHKFREAVAYFDAQKDDKGKVVRDANSRPLSVWRKVKKAVRSDYDKKTVKDGLYFPKKISMF